jgi:CHASE3 domain sensor protein
MIEIKVQELDVRLTRVETQQGERSESDARRWDDYMSNQAQARLDQKKADEEFKSFVKDEIQKMQSIVIKSVGAILLAILGVVTRLIFKGVI